MCWSGAQTGLSHCSLYPSAGRRASMSLLVLQLFVSGFRGNDDCFQKLPVTCSLHGSVCVADGCIARGIQLFVSDAGKSKQKGPEKKKPDVKGWSFRRLIGYGQSTPDTESSPPDSNRPNPKAG